jgi:hypothetical protein
MRGLSWFAGLMVVVVGAAAPGCSCSDSGVIGDPSGDGDGGGGGGDAGNGTGGGCVPKTCEEVGKNCGPVSNGCGGFTECGDCPDGQICGGGGPSICGAGTGGGPREDCDSGLCEHQVACPGMGTYEATTVTGVVFAPDGKTPLNNAVVYVPNDPNPANLPPISEGATCERCEDEDLGDPIAAAVTGPDGSFILRHVPAGVSFPLVVKAGKWRRAVTISSVTACNTVALSAEQTRLPRTKLEGHIPRMAVSTGRVDALECVLYKMGVAASEFTRPTGNGRIHMYVSNGAWADQALASTCSTCTPSSTSGSSCSCTNLNCGSSWPAICRAQRTRNLYRDQAVLDSYDMAFFGCDHPLNGSDRNDQWTEDDHRVRFRGYANKGGRIFLSHYNYEWLSRSRAPSEYRNLANYGGGWMEGLSDPSPAWIDTGFGRGLTFAQWLELIGASHDDPSEGHILIHEPRTHIASLNAPARRWVYTTQADHNRNSVQTFTVNAPVTAPESESCGRVVYSAFHVTGGEALNLRSQAFPNHCQGELSSQELALVYMMFDLAACISDDDTRVPPSGCTPITCEQAGAQCGTIADGCGGLRSCGTCPDGQLCSNVTNRCQQLW